MLAACIGQEILDQHFDDIFCVAPGGGCTLVSMMQEEGNEAMYFPVQFPEVSFGSFDSMLDFLENYPIYCAHDLSVLEQIDGDVVILKDYADTCNVHIKGILNFCEKCLNDAHDKAGKQLGNQTYQMRGDQLTREIFSEAKSTRAHHLNPSDKCSHLSPLTFELLHMLMSYLKILLNISYIQESGKDIGTLKSLQDKNYLEKILMTMLMVTMKQIKTFFLSVTDMYIVDCFLEFFWYGR
ncbi:unnamed protein product [Mytilus coruscus]|uniref:DUF6589 domain-containing protein n=1 Tax=Mytilus coruscus TaxID=42192 RepID=A0A6J8CQL7_MYTCO|nr:unnamed protein product [Mytilus coruscus]